MNMLDILMENKQDIKDAKDRMKELEQTIEVKELELQHFKRKLESKKEFIKAREIENNFIKSNGLI